MFSVTAFQDSGEESPSEKLICSQQLKTGVKYRKIRGRKKKTKRERDTYYLRHVSNLQKMISTLCWALQIQNITRTAGEIYL